MPRVENSYKEVYDSFEEGVIRDRFVYLYERMRRFIKASGLDGKVFVHVDLLSHAVMDYFTDIYRLKQFEGIERVNRQKILSYESYWILKRKPLQLIEGEGMSDEALFSNEAFLATYIGHGLLSEIHALDNEAAQPEGYFDFIDHVFYHLKYRDSNPKSLELMMAAFCAGGACNRAE